MKIKSLSKEEIEVTPFDDLAYIILREKGKKMKTAEIFKIICDSVGLTEKQYEERIADFFTLLATEKRFVQLPKGYWDLKENHTTEVKIENNLIDSDDDDDLELEIEENIEETEEAEDEYDADNEKDDEIDDGLKDLVVIDEIDEERE